MKMPKQHPKMSQKVANMGPKWAQVGAMLGAKIDLDPPKSEEKTTTKTTPKKHTKNRPRETCLSKGTGSAFKCKDLRRMQMRDEKCGIFHASIRVG